MIALQARMQASYQDHIAQTQGLNAKVSSRNTNNAVQISMLLFAFLFVALSVIWQLIYSENAVFSFFYSLRKKKNFGCLETDLKQLSKVRESNTVGLLKKHFTDP